MNNSLKIGIISGLIAGIAAGIVASFFHVLMISIGFLDSAGYIVETQIIMNIIWGIILGVIYSKVHMLIPGKAITKGIFFGLFILLITNVRDATFWLPYGIYTLDAIGFSLVGFFQYITYGSILGILHNTLLGKYHIPKVKLKIKTYSMVGGIFPGAIAGLVGGIIAFLSRLLGSILGLFPFADIQIDFTVLAGVASLHILLNMFWGTVVGTGYPKVYNLIPSKGIVKGFYFGLIFFLVATLRSTFYFVGWENPVAFHWGFVGFWQVIVYGPLLGLLYKPPK